MVITGCAPAPRPISGLRPEYPKPTMNNANIEVNSLQPTLQWESLQQLVDRESKDTNLLSRITHVVYDLSIWRANRDYPRDIPNEMVYSRQGLTATNHTLERPLKPSTDYFWTVRARFDLDGHPRATQWGTMFSQNSYNVSSNDWHQTASRIPLPNPFYYRLRTPKRSASP
ncbi:MAG TPA: hypothetical protein VEI24_00655 [Nitrospiria bacterium]|nr:hypothetical protein [Nitrospiria bacterium]